MQEPTGRSHESCYEHKTMTDGLAQLVIRRGPQTRRKHSRRVIGRDVDELTL